MPPMVCPSPILLDHSFPESEIVLNQVIGALGNLQEARDDGNLILVASPVFPTFTADIAWEKVSEFPALRDVHRYLTMLFLQPNASYVAIDTDRLGDAAPHPLPENCPQTDVAAIWSAEVGKIRVLHDERTTSGPFLGVACHRGFSGGQTGSYGANAGPHLPLVGLNNYQQLASGMCWEFVPDIANQPVRYRDAKRNMKLLDGTISPHAEGSHYTVHFRNGNRPWVLDSNIDPISEEYLKQIPAIIGKPIEYVKQALIYGTIPKLANILS